MHPASASIKYFGLYVALTGIGLAVAPALVLTPLGVAAPTEIWVRVLGVLALVVGYYYWVCGRADAVEFFRASIRGRILFAVLLLLLVAVFSAPVQLLLFGVIDLVGAAWTAQGLRTSDRAALSAASRG
jgi:hypothetical protein